MGVKEKVLTAVDSITSGDFLRVVTSAGYARKIDYNKLAKAIVENYAGSSLAGSSQSLKAAIDSLNSNFLYRGRNNFTSLSELTSADAGVYNTGSSNVPGIRIETFSILFKPTKDNLSGSILFVNNGMSKGQLRYWDGEKYADIL